MLKELRDLSKNPFPAALRCPEIIKQQPYTLTKRLKVTILTIKPLLHSNNLSKYLTIEYPFQLKNTHPWKSLVPWSNKHSMKPLRLGRVLHAFFSTNDNWSTLHKCTSCLSPTLKKLCLKWSAFNFYIEDNKVRLSKNLVVTLILLALHCNICPIYMQRKLVHHRLPDFSLSHWDGERDISPEELHLKS